jgi:hypothetical protein
MYTNIINNFNPILYKKTMNTAIIKELLKKNSPKNITNIFLCILFLFVIPLFNYARATAAVTSSSNSGDLSNQTTASWSHTTSGSNRYLVVGLSGWDDASSLTDVNVSYAGVPMTKLGGEQTGGNNNAVLWGLVNPASGDNTVSITNVPAGFAELGGGSVSFSGVNQSIPVGTLVSSQGQTADLSLSSGDIGIDVFYAGGDGSNGRTQPIPGANETVRINQSTNAAAKWHMMGTETGSGNTTLDWTQQGGANDAAIAAVAVKTASGQTDSTPPSPDPTLNTPTVISSSQINLSWSASSDPESGIANYELYRCQGTSCTPTTLIASPTGTSYNDTPLTANTTYRYRVRAVNGAGLPSGYSGVVQGVTPIATYIFQDGFETGNLSHTENGMSWFGSVATAVSTAQKLTGNYSLAFNYAGVAAGQDSWAEQRIDLGAQHTELWIQYDLFIPSNYDHRNESPGNNKFIAIYRDPYQTPGFQVNLSTEPNGSGGSHMYIHYYRNGTELSPIFAKSDFITSADEGQWMNLIMRFKVPTSSSSNDGVIEVWKNGTPSFSVTNMSSFGGSGQNYMDEAYILGWSSAGFSQTTVFYVDNFIISATPLTPSSDSTPPTSPTLNNPTVISSSQINLSWTASTDNVGVTGYRVERCTGSPCLNFTQIASPSGTTYNDTGLTPNTVYRYRVLAVDAAENLSDYSNVVNATTQQASPATIFSDDFESSLSWTKTGNTTWYTGSPKNGTHSVRLRVTGSIEKVISLSGYQNINVSFKMGANSLDNNNENVQALYYNGTSWQTLAQINNNSANENNQLNPYTFALPSTVNNLSTFRLRFKINGSGTNDNAYIDDVVISGTP